MHWTHSQLQSNLGLHVGVLAEWHNFFASIPQHTTGACVMRDINMVCVLSHHHSCVFAHGGFELLVSLVPLGVQCHDGS